MREFKFRAWNQNDKDYTYFDLSTISMYDIQLNMVILEQFTGLQDKNGVDIYEGDILKQGKYTYELEYCTQNCVFVLNCISDDIISVLQYQQLGNGYYNRRDLEVIGNIHEK